MSGARDIKKKIPFMKGSITMETAIVMPFFLVILLSLAYIIRIFYAYNIVQSSLTEVARGIGNMSYFYYVSGFIDYSDQLNEIADASENTLEEQKNTVIDAFTNFNSIASGLQNTIEPGSSSESDINNLLEKAENFDENMTDIKEMVRSIVSDPQSELTLLLTLFSQNLTYEVRNRVVCYAARINLSSELNKRLGTSRHGQAALILGIKEGIEGMNFEQSSVFGDSESLEFTVNYNIKAPMPFGSVIPELRLANRVKIIAWTGGRGVSVKNEDETQQEDGIGNSLWMEMDQDKNYCDRGLAMENLYVKTLINEKKKSGLQAFMTPGGFPVIDAYTFNNKLGEAEYYDIFTLNPFMKSYRNNPTAISREIKRHGKRLLECEMPSYLDSVDIRNIKRIVVMIVPENSESYASEATIKAQQELEKYNIEVRFVKDYGTYTTNEEAETQD